MILIIDSIYDPPICKSIFPGILSMLNHLLFGGLNNIPKHDNPQLRLVEELLLVGRNLGSGIGSVDLGTEGLESSLVGEGELSLGAKAGMHVLAPSEMGQK